MKKLKRENCKVIIATWILGGGSPVMTTAEESVKPVKKNRTKFLVGGAMIIAAIIYLIVSSTQANAQYYLTVRELEDQATAMTGKEVRVSGAILGETIQYDPQTLTLAFTVAHITGDNDEITAQGGLAEVLYQATQDTSLPRLKVIYNGVKPDLLRNEAQAIMTGKLGADGVFYADELLLKCPTRYEDAVPDQAEG
jgi:cytochrome c-type biogenesis protein CcmE